MTDVSSQDGALEANLQYLDTYALRLRDDMEALLFKNRARRSLNQTVIVPITAKSSDFVGTSHLASELPELYTHFVLIGEGGSGKTTVLREMALLAAHAYLAKEVGAQLPIYLSLSQVMSNIYSLLHENMKQANISEGTLQHYLRQGLLFLILDGLNEIPESIREQSQQEIIQLMEQYGQNRFVIATRPPWIGSVLGLRSFELQQLTNEQIIDYIKKCIGSDTKSTEIFLRQLGVKGGEQWKAPRSLITLARNPMTLSWMVEVGVSERQNRGWLIDDLMRHRLNQDTNKNYAQKVTALQELAYNMIAEQDVTTYGSLERIKENFSRLPPSHNHENLFQEILGSDILQRSGNGLTWMHQSIQEFFGARAIETRWLSGESLERYVQNLEWHESLVLLAGLLDQPVLFLETILALDPFLGARCYCYAEALASHNTLRDQLISRLVQNRVNLWALTGDHWQVEQLIREEIAHHATLGLYQLLGKLIESQLRYDEALVVFEMSTALEGLTPSEQFEQLCNVGNIHRRYGRHQDALRIFSQAEAIAQESDYHDRDDWLYYELAYVYEKEGQVKQALHYYTLSFRAGMAVGQAGRAHIATAQAACILCRSGRYRTAEHLLQRSLRVFKMEPQRNVRWIANTEAHLIEAFIGLGDFTRAKQLLDGIQSGANTAHIKRGRPTFDLLFKTGRYYLSQGLYQEALTSLLQALKLADDFADVDRDRVAELYHDVGLVHLSIGKEQEAIHFFKQSLNERKNLMNCWGHAQSYLALGKLALQSRQLEEAKQFLKQSLMLFRQVHSTQQLVAEELLGKITYRKDEC